jgi:hypothetical protein
VIHSSQPDEVGSGKLGVGEAANRDAVSRWASVTFPEDTAAAVRAEMKADLETAVGDPPVLLTTSYPSPKRSTAPGAKFSVKTSAFFAISLTNARPRSSLRLTVNERLLVLCIMK